MVKKATKEVLGFDDTIFLLIGIPLISFLIPLLFFNSTLSEGLLPYLPKWGVSLIYTLCYWFTTRAIIIYLRKRFPYHQETRKRLIYSAMAIIAMFTIVHFLLDATVHPYLETLHAPDPGVKDFDYIVASFTILTLCATIYESIFLYAAWKKSIIEKEQLKRENIQSQFEGLKAQVNPHFLFKSLNTLTYIIPEDPDKAVQFVQKLSKVYRYILEIRDKELISLEEEITFLQSYIFLLKERFGENLQIHIEVPPEVLQFQTIPLSLQILFENAIKHNIISTQKPLTIEVFIEKGSKLLVKNNLQKKKQAMSSTKIGLQNIKNRYAFFTQEEVDIIVTTESFMVSLPLIKVPSKVF